MYLVVAVLLFVQFLFHRQKWDQTIIFEDNAGTHYRTEASSTLRQTGRRALVLLLAVGCLRLLKVLLLR